jgi:hypothetical protein
MAESRQFVRSSRPLPVGRASLAQEVGSPKRFPIIDRGEKGSALGFRLGIATGIAAPEVLQHHFNVLEAHRRLVEQRIASKPRRPCMITSTQLAGGRV